MTVGELIAKLQGLNPDLPISVNDEDGGNWYENVDFVYEFTPDPKYPEDQPCVVIVVNECV